MITFVQINIHVPTLKFKTHKLILYYYITGYLFIVISRKCILRNNINCRYLVR